MTRILETHKCPYCKLEYKWWYIPYSLTTNGISVTHEIQNLTEAKMINYIEEDKIYRFRVVCPDCRKDDIAFFYSEKLL